ALSSLSASDTARLPWTHFGSMGLSHGLLLGNWQTTTRTPTAPCFTCRLCWRIQCRTAGLRCQEALSQINSNAVKPWEIGRASCRERVEMWVGEVVVK